MKLPWMRFYTRDWLDNKELRRCSPPTRAVLADLMCLAHEGEPYGHLSDKVGALTVKYMASRCFVTNNQLLRAIAELKQHERIAETDDGILFIPRMVEDEEQREARKADGHKSRGNPDLGRNYNSPGCVYLIRRASDNAVKIGIAVNVQSRVYKLKTANRPDILTLVDSFEVEDMGKTEAALHEEFAAKRVIGEWFALTDEDVSKIATSFKGNMKGSTASSLERITPACSGSESDSDSSENTSGGNVFKFPLAGEFPETAAAIRSKFRSAPDTLVVEVAHLATQEYVNTINGAPGMPDLNDPLIAEAVHEAHFKRQDSPFAYKTTVPRVVKTWAEEALRQQTH